MFHDSTSPIASEPRSFWRRHRVKLALSLALGAALAWLMNRGALPLVPTREAFAEIRWSAVVIYAVGWSLMHFIRGGRWFWLLAAVSRVPLGTVLRVAFIGFASLVVFPFRMGEVVRPLLIAREGKVSGWAATGTVGAERIIDGLFLSVFLFVVLRLSKPLEPLPDRIGDLPVPVAVVPQTAYVALAVFSVAFAAMGVFYFRAEWGRRITEAVLGVVSKKAARLVADRVAHVASGLRFLGGPRHALPFLLATLLYWSLNASLYWVLGVGCGLEGMTLLEASAVMCVLALGIVLPNAPGFFGAFQLSIYAALALYFQPADVIGKGSVYVFLVYTIQMAITLVAGGISSLITFYSNRQPKSEAVESA